MAIDDDIKGEGFEVIGHSDKSEQKPEPPEASGGERASERPAQSVKGEGFEVIGHEEPAAEEGTASPAGEAATAPGAEEELQPIDVYAMLRVMVGQLSAVAWQKMGLQADPFTNKTHKDLDQARVAIDCAVALAEKVLSRLQGQEKRDLESLLTDLRMNFVRQSGR
jgi:hypothetical protein